MVIEEALKNYTGRYGFLNAVAANKPFILLGAASPDAAYFSHLEDIVLNAPNWSDRMHYEKTGGFVRKGVDNLLAYQGHDAAKFSACLAWLAGYASHVITDTVIHPVVNSVVGPYMFNRGEHRHCEAVQDSLIFEVILGSNLPGSKYAQFLYNFDSTAIHGLWAKTLRDTHSSCHERIDIDGWLWRFRNIIAFAQRNYYKKTDEIPVKEKNAYFYSALLPDRTACDFRDVPFNKAVKETITAWDKLFAGVDAGGDETILSYFKNWNLDTGEDMDGAYFWNSPQSADATGN